ncbi:hypothetical protein O8C97_12120, partial [Aliarcobacter butzleri]|uniref:hypothetical protein n=1 Tax=Aliarcobacter butzleri TaxID=28197 RepID=UPI00263E0535
FFTAHNTLYVVSIISASTIVTGSYFTVFTFVVSAFAIYTYFVLGLGDSPDTYLTRRPQRQIFIRDSSSIEGFKTLLSNSPHLL